MTWREAIEIAERHGYRYDTPSPDAMDAQLYAQLAMALWRAAEAKRGGKLNEYVGIAVGDREFVEWVLSGRVPL